MNGYGELSLDFDVSKELEKIYLKTYEEVKDRNKEMVESFEKNQNFQMAYKI